MTFDNLMTACRHGNLEEFKRLLSEGVTDFEKNETLRVSCVLGRLEMVKLLVENGADVHKMHDAPIKCAIYYNQTEIINYFKKVLLRERLLELN
jgi:ankyrin repeat protein